MVMVLLAAAVLWGGCAILVIGAVFLSRVLPPLSTLLFEAPLRAEPLPRAPER